MVAVFLLVFPHAHVPTYGTSCVEPPHDHTVSQVVYLKGSGGLEVHIRSDTDPFDTINGENFTIQTVFRDEVDPSTYSLHIGCGGCMANDPVLAPRVAIDYQPGKLEPFTQTFYRDLFPKSQQLFNARALQGCDHFTIRLIAFPNASTIVWGAVIGLAEAFTIGEILSFPIYILRNHGSAWNNLGWTIFIAFLLAIFWLWALREAFGACGVRLPDLPRHFRISYWIKRPCTKDEEDADDDPSGRELSYELALVAFSTAWIENLIHTAVAQANAEVDGALLTALLVNTVSNGLGIVFVFVAWESSRYFDETVDVVDRDNSCCASCWRCSGHPAWAVAELLTGLSFFFLFGAGFFIGPSALVLAAVFRLFGLIQSGQVDVAALVRGGCRNVVVCIRACNCFRTKPNEKPRAREPPSRRKFLPLLPLPLAWIVLGRFRVR